MCDSMNNAIRMVVINSALNFFFKLPQALIPLEMTVAAFYYQRKSFKNCGNKCNYGYMVFFNRLRNSRLHYIMPDFSDLLKYFYQ